MATPADIRKAAEILARGGIVVIPTDTVYGLAADATNPAAVSKIYAAKGRAFDKPLIVFVFAWELAGEFSKTTPLAERLAGQFLPGPLSLVLKKRPGFLAPNVSGQFETVGVRIPDHPAARALLKICPFPLAVTSANPSGAKSPTRPEDVTLEADLVLAAGETPGGVESTVIDATGKTPVVLRQGALKVEVIDAFLTS